MKIIFISQSILFLVYLIYIYCLFGWTDSISKSYYKLQKKGWQFTVFLCMLGIPMFALGTGWFFFAGAFLFFCGIAAEYKEKMTSTVHYIGASGAIVLSCVGLCYQGIYAPAIAIPILSIVLRKVKNRTYWVEVISFVAIEAGVLYHIW